eukprot:8544752-Pyramimonas_sp.AAC.1
MAVPALCAVILTSPLPSALRYNAKPMALDGGDEERDAEERRGGCYGGEVRREEELEPEGQRHALGIRESNMKSPG